MFCLLNYRGVVQLFNSVKTHQKTMQNRLQEAGPLERKREKALKSINKSDFLDLLQGGSKNKKVRKARRILAFFYLISVLD